MATAHAVATLALLPLALEAQTSFPDATVWHSCDRFEENHAAACPDGQNFLHNAHANADSFSGMVGCVYGNEWQTKGYGRLTNGQGEYYLPDEVCTQNGFDGVGDVYMAHLPTARLATDTNWGPMEPAYGWYCNAYAKVKYFEKPDYETHTRPEAKIKNDMAVNPMTWQCVNYGTERAHCCDPTASWEGACYSKRGHANNWLSCAEIDDVDYECAGACGRGGIVYNEMRGSKGATEDAEACGTCCRALAEKRGLWNCQPPSAAKCNEVDDLTECRNLEHCQPKTRKGALKKCMDVKCKKLKQPDQCGKVDRCRVVTQTGTDVFKKCVKKRGKKRGD